MVIGTNVAYVGIDLSSGIETYSIKISLSTTLVIKQILKPPIVIGGHLRTGLVFSYLYLLAGNK
jgi:hypothetical protein